MRQEHTANNKKITFNLYNIIIKKGCQPQMGAEIWKKMLENRGKCGVLLVKIGK